MTTFCVYACVCVYVFVCVCVCVYVCVCVGVFVWLGGLRHLFYLNTSLLLLLEMQQLHVQYILSIFMPHS